MCQSMVDARDRVLGCLLMLFQLLLRLPLHRNQLIGSIVARSHFTYFLRHTILKFSYARGSSVRSRRSKQQVEQDNDEIYISFLFFDFLLNVVDVVASSLLLPMRSFSVVFHY